MFQRFQDIGVGPGVAAEHPADERHGNFQMHEIDFTPERVHRPAEIQHNEPRTWPGHAEHFVQAALPVRQIPQPVADGHDVERIVGKRNLQRVALHELRISFLTSDFRLPASRRRDFKHLRAEVEPDGFRAAMREGEGDVAGAAAQIEGAGAGFRSGQFGDAAFPAAVQAEALKVVEQIVAARNGGKEVVDLRGARFAGRVKNVAHAGKSSTMDNLQSKPIYLVCAGGRFGCANACRHP